MDDLEKIKEKLIVDIAYHLETHIKGVAGAFSVARPASGLLNAKIFLGSSWIVWKWSDSLDAQIATNFTKSKWTISAQSSVEDLTDAFCQILDHVGMEYDVGQQINVFKDRIATAYVVTAKSKLTIKQIEKIRSFDI
jgi:hypothetical protein